MKRSKTFTVTYNYFEPGTKVTPTSGRCPLEPGVYTVTRCLEPMFPEDTCCVFVEGRKVGVSTTYLGETDGPG